MEEDLKRALRREPAPPDFTKRVIERVRAGRAPARHWQAIAATLLLVITLGGWTAHTIAERRAEVRAKDEVLLALRIAGSKIRYAQSQVHQIGRR